MKISYGNKQVDIAWNMADRIATWLNPEVGAKRMQSRAFLAEVGGYEGGRRDKRMLRNWRPLQKSPNQINSEDNVDLRSRTRDLARNVPIATSAIDTLVSNVIGDGLVVQPQVDKEFLGITDEQAIEWQKAAKREFELWAENPDFTERSNFDEMQAIVFRAVLEGGDILIARRNKKGPRDTYKLKLLMIEAERISNPSNGSNTDKLVDGVVLDNGVPKGYWISTHYPDDTTPGIERSWKYYDKGMTLTGQPLLLHLYDIKRPDQARGIPYLAPVVETIKTLGRYTDAEVHAAVVSAMFTVFVKKNSTPTDGDVASFIGDNNSNTANVATDGSETQLGNGAIIDLADGEEIQIADPKRPNSAFDGFVKSFTKLIGAALNIPHEILMRSFESSYSASRGSLEIAWQYFNMRRVWFTWKFLQTIYEWVITEAIVAGRLEAMGFFADPIVRKAWLGSLWVSSISRISLDPSKEADAWGKHIEMGTTNRAIVTAEYDGRDWEQVNEQLGRENELRKAMGLGVAPVAPADPNAPAPNSDPEGPDDPEEPTDPEEENEDA